MGEDALYVFCEGSRTCVFPDLHSADLPPISWRRDRIDWYSKLRGGARVIKIF
jgi:collagen type V/XI/XXIV/XXVII alpha